MSDYTKKQATDDAWDLIGHSFVKCSNCNCDMDLVVEDNEDYDPDDWDDTCVFENDFKYDVYLVCPQCKQAIDKSEFDNIRDWED